MYDLILVPFPVDAGNFGRISLILQFLDYSYRLTEYVPWIPTPLDLLSAKICIRLILFVHDDLPPNFRAVRFHNPLLYFECLSKHGRELSRQISIME